MSKLKVLFAIRSGKLRLCVKTPKTKTPSYKIIKNLINPDLRYWNNEKQSFEGNTYEANYNNRLLQEIMECCEFTLNKYNPSNGIEFLNYLKYESTVQNKNPENHKTITPLLHAPQEAIETRPTKYIPQPGVKATLTLADFDDESLFAELRRRGFTGELTYCRTIAV